MGLPDGPIGGLAMTIGLTVTATTANTAIGFLLGDIQALGPIWIRAPIFIYVLAIRDVPFITFVFWVFYFLPTIPGYRASGLESAIIALTVYHAAFISLSHTALNEHCSPQCPFPS